MSNLEPNKKGINARVAGSLAIVGLMLMVAGCMNNPGRLAMNAEVGQAFLTGHSQTGYQYFYSGRDTMPYAIIGIDSSYTVPSRYWIPFEPESDKLKKMSGNMYWKMRYDPYGSHIFAPDGTMVGVWFSSVRFPIVRVDQQKRTVEVLFNNPENVRDF